MNKLRMKLINFSFI